MLGHKLPAINSDESIYNQLLKTDSDYPYKSQLGAHRPSNAVFWRWHRVFFKKNQFFLIFARYLCPKERF